MVQQLALSEPQLNLILELLESEQKELLVEIRHTDNAVFSCGFEGTLGDVGVAHLQSRGIGAGRTTRQGSLTGCCSMKTMG